MSFAESVERGATYVRRRCTYCTCTRSDSVVKNVEREDDVSTGTISVTFSEKSVDSAEQITNGRFIVCTPDSTENKVEAGKSCSAGKEYPTNTRKKMTSFSVMNYSPMLNRNGDSTTNFLPYKESEDKNKSISVASCSSAERNETNTESSTSSASISDLDYITIALPPMFHDCNEETEDCRYKDNKIVKEVGLLMKDPNKSESCVNGTNKSTESCRDSPKVNVNKLVDVPVIRDNSKKNDLVIQHLPSLNIRSELVTQPLPMVEIKCTESTVETSCPSRNICYEIVRYSSTEQVKCIKENSEKTNQDIETTSYPKIDANLDVDMVVEALAADPTAGPILKTYEALPKKNIIDDDALDTNSTIRNEIDGDVYQTYIASTKRDRRNVLIKEIASQKEQNFGNVDLNEIKIKLEGFLNEIEKCHSLSTIYLEQKENIYAKEDSYDKLPRKFFPDEVIDNLKQLGEISINCNEQSLEVSEKAINLKYYPDVFPNRYVLHCDEATEISITSENSNTKIEKVTQQHLNDSTASVGNQTKLCQKQLASRDEKRTEDTLKRMNYHETKNHINETIETNEKESQTVSDLNNSKITCKQSHQETLEDNSSVCEKKYILVMDSRNLRHTDVLCACVSQMAHTRDVGCCEALISRESIQVQTDLPLKVNSKENCEDSESINETVSTTKEGICENDSLRKTVAEKDIHEKYSSSKTEGYNKGGKCSTKTVKKELILRDTEFKETKRLIAEAETQSGVSLNNLLLSNVDIIVPSCKEQLSSEYKPHSPQLKKNAENGSTVITKCTNQNVLNYECKSKSVQVSAVKTNTFYCECSEEKELVNIDLQYKPVTKKCKTKKEDVTIKRNVGIQTTKKCSRGVIKCPKSTRQVESTSTSLGTSCVHMSTSSEECWSCEDTSQKKEKKPFFISQHVQVNITETKNEVDIKEASPVKGVPKERNNPIYKTRPSNSYFEEKRSVKIQTSMKMNSINHKSRLFDHKQVNNKNYNHNPCTRKSKQRCSRQIGIQKGPSCNWAQCKPVRKFSSNDDATDSECTSGPSSDFMSEGEVRQSVSVGELYPCDLDCASFYKKNPEKLLKQQTGDKNVCLLRERTVYDNWKSYYFSHESRPSK